MNKANAGRAPRGGLAFVLKLLALAC